MDLVPKYLKTKNMSPENYASLKNKGISPHVIIDTTDFQDYCRQHGYDNASFHSKIWRPYMCDSFCGGGAYVHFSKHENIENEFHKLLNLFFDDYPEFNNEVKMMFTN